ncbi:hypothetical protein GL213_12880 [Halogeometricum borinquense]|uniref:DUF8054 domain-containing protein n=2 Tax=Halogeometricum borinquense TaxID=60847 RepID=E4NT55_HALBP|nr:hypothetical protein [Halogeometricum borinquense]ADQ68152.1 hypothetical protein Hbor_25990 [Halogeometricum borinquense DSM 11551]ELY24804.1 hypothetical protein C499_15440 [Halogeometricum borinquense DSM 11551]QIB73262.1 hypothetical protein G3I44_02560 [Halogeometricum borinquense]QIQ77343.1 hypothetical protein GL213_12880 [Halogeometricum borinquense]RYJ12947.1 hypothetical protein ELS19_02490 [Halogeometricum borinquense]
MTVQSDSPFRIPEGDLLQSRVVSDADKTLAAVLDRELTGYVVFEPQGSLLGGGDDATVLTFEEGVPVLAYDAATDRGGPDALAALDAAGPYRVELFELDPEDVAVAHRDETCRVPPARPADRLAADPELAERTRDAAPDHRLADEQSSVEEFLADADRIEAIKAEARQEAQSRAEEWGLTDQLDR